MLLTLQMWNSVFWTCMALSRCVDSSINDVDFIGTVIKSMPQLLQGISIKPQTALSGYSNGGMLVQALLCQQPSIANSLTGVALIGTMLGTNFASSSCQQKLPRALPLMWIHGQQDPVLPYGPGGRSMGVAALGAGEEGGTGCVEQKSGFGVCRSCAAMWVDRVQSIITSEINCMLVFSLCLQFVGCVQRLERSCGQTAWAAQVRAALQPQCSAMLVLA